MTISPCSWSSTQKGCLLVSMLLLQLLLPLVGGQQLFEGGGGGQCTILPKPAPLRTNGRTNIYKVGVFGIRGADQAFADYNITFNEYLTEMVGNQFEPPIRFELVPIFNSKEGFLDFLADGAVDFMFMHTGAYSCIESEVGARSLATVVSRRVVNDQVFTLNGYGGVIFTRAENEEINTLQDIRGKRTSCVAITAFGSGQVQFRDLIQAGIHHIQDVSQLVFMEKQPRVVNAVLKGEVDIGYVRTDQLERTIDEETGELVDLSKIKVVRPQTDLLDDGKAFPFPSTSRLYPEWSLSAFPHVPNDVAQAVQAQILQMEDHAALAGPLLACYEQENCSGLLSIENATQCQNDCYDSLDSEALQRCDTTPETAFFAAEAMLKGRIAGWSPSASYMEVRNMQEDLGFLQFGSETGVRCIRTTELSDAVTCPPGHFKKSTQEIEQGCAEVGIDCYGYQCLCSPCVKAFDVDFFDYSIYQGDEETGTSNTAAAAKSGLGCGKFELCGDVEQGESITFRAIDNRKREGVIFSAMVLKGSEEEIYEMVRRTDIDFAYEFTFDATDTLVGELIVIVNVDDEQIPESPFRISISEKDCVAEESGLTDKVADAYGECICESNSVDMFSSCVPLSILLPSIIIPVLAILTLTVYFIVEEKRKAADAIWKVNPKEILYDAPPRVLGRGTFGLVLLGEYRGTKVAVKRVLPPKRKTTKNDTKFDFDEGEEQRTQLTAGMDSTNGALSQVNSKRGFMSSRSSSVGAQFGGWFGYSEASDYKRLEKEFVHEMRLLSKLRHPCITTTMGAVLDRKSEPMMIIEHMDLGSLYDLLHNDSMVLDGEILLPMLRDIARGLRFLHAATPQIIHSDLKAGNVLVDGRFHAKVSDFGLSRKRLFQDRAAGTPFWMAPELLRHETSNTPESDVYSFGMVLYEVMSRKDPYEGEQGREVLQLVADDKISKRPSVPKGSPPESAELMRACLRADPRERPTAEDISIRLDMLEPENVIILVQDRRQSSAQRKVTSAEDLLALLFPKHIAIALREGRKVQPEPHNSVTVYFSDIVDYTIISASLSPTKVSSLLDRLYTKFDDLCDKYDVFKVETVGDAYMTVTNIAKKQPKHAELMAAFAVEALEAASTTLIDEADPTRGYVRIRSGFHTGPVVAHVVGNRNPRYSIIGDTVNTAARMESNSKVGRIQCSEVSAKIIERGTSDIRVKRRGEVHIKGKGDMALYWVNAAGSQDQSDEMSVNSEHHLGARATLERIMEDATVDSTVPSMDEPLKKTNNRKSSEQVWTQSADHE